MTEQYSHKNSNNLGQDSDLGKSIMRKMDSRHFRPPGLHVSRLGHAPKETGHAQAPPAPQKPHLLH